MMVSRNINCHVAAGAGDDAHHDADDGGAEIDHGIADQVLQVDLGRLELGDHALIRRNDGVFYRGEDLGDAEQADDGGDHGDAAHQKVVAEGEPGLALHGIHADAGHHQTHAAHHQALQHVLGGQGGDDGQAEHRQ